MKKISIFLILIISLVLLSGCVSIDYEREKNDQAMEACIKQNGVPILGIHSDYMSCKFKNE